MVHYTVETNLHPKMWHNFQKQLKKYSFKEPDTIYCKLQINDWAKSIECTWHGNLVVTCRADAGNPIADSYDGAIM